MRTTPFSWGLTTSETESDRLFEPLVSAVIPTYNSAATIQACLASLRTQSYGDVEVIVVDNASCDGTAQIARSQGAITFEHRGNRTCARNYGVRMSRGKYVLSVDSDMELPQKIIEECVKACEEGSVDALILPELSVGEGYIAECRSLQKRVFSGERGYESARFISRKAFDLIGGYDESLEAGEDFDIQFRLERADFRISRASSTVLHHEGRLSPQSIVKKARHYGQTIGVYAVKNREYIERQETVVAVYARKWRILIGNITLIPGLFFIHWFEFLATGRHSRRLFHKE